MKKETFKELNKGFVQLENKLKEYFTICDEYDKKIKLLEDGTNLTLQEEDEKIVTVADNFIKKYGDYLDSALTYGRELIQNIENLKVYFDQHCPGASSVMTEYNREVSYYMEPKDNIEYLERLYNGISLKVSECINGRNQNLLSFGRKLIGYDNENYRDISNLFAEALSFGSGLKEWFDNLYEQQYTRVKNDQKSKHDEICAMADKKLEEYDKTFMDQRDVWMNSFIQVTEETLSCHFIDELKCLYEKSVYDNSSLAMDKPRSYIPIGTLYFYFGSLKGFDKLYEFMNQKYQKYVNKDYLAVKALWNAWENQSIILHRTRKQSTWWGQELESMICKPMLTTWKFILNPTTTYSGWTFYMFRVSCEI